MPPMMIHHSQLYDSNMPLSFLWSSVESAGLPVMRQRASAVQVPLLVENRWRKA
jgi:hypothetical protein